jgi:hypothetical protein
LSYHGQLRRRHAGLTLALVAQRDRALEAEDAQLRLAALKALEKVAAVDPAAWERRVAESKALARARRCGWRLLPDGIWRGPHGELVESLEDVARILDHRRHGAGAQPRLRAATR